MGSLLRSLLSARDPIDLRLRADEEALAIDVASVLNLELLDLQEVGCDVLQIDEPAMTRYHEKVAAYGARALDRCLEGIHVPTIVHLCYGYPGGGGQHEYEYPDLLRELMKRGSVDSPWNLPEATTTRKFSRSAGDVW